MADEINVQVKASIGSLTSAMKEASSSVRDFSTQTKEQVALVGSAFEGLNGIMFKFGALLAGGAFFKEAISSTVKWTEEVRALSKQFGVTTEQASGLALAIDAVGANVDDYASAATKLDRQIKSNEDNVNALGVATREANGALLSQQELMMNAINGLNLYKEGTDKNIAAQFLFGRGSADLAKILRLTNEEIAAGAEDAKKFGLEVSSQADGEVFAYKRAVNDVGDAFQGVQRVVGTALIPVMTSLAETFTENSKALQVIEIMVKTLGTAFLGLKTIAQAITNAIGSYFAELVINFQTYTEQIAAYATLNFTKANEAARNGQERLDATMKEAKDKMSQDMAALAEQAAKIWNIGGVNDKPKVAPAGEPAGGGKTVPKGFGSNEAIAEAKKEQQERIKLAQEESNMLRGLARIQLESKREDLDQEVALGTITMEKKYQLLQDYANEEHRLEVQALNDQIKTDGLSLLEKQKIKNQLLALEQKHALDVKKISNASVQEQMKSYSQIFSTLRSSFSSAIQGILQGTQTWRQAMANIFSNLLSSFVGMLADMALRWIETQVMMALFGGTTSRGEVASNAAVAGSGAYAATAVIPVIGPMLAPGAAAMAYAGALAYGALIPSFEVGSWKIPGDTLANIHEGEMIIPKPFAESMRENGGLGGQASVNIHLSAIDTRSGVEFLKQHASTIAKAINGQVRNANPALAGMRGA